MQNKFDLSERELQVLHELATGASNKDIGGALFISPSTVKVHLKKIYKKLDVNSRFEATQVARRAGLLESDDEEALDSDPEPISTSSNPEPGAIAFQKEIEATTSQKDNLNIHISSRPEPVSISSNPEPVPISSNPEPVSISFSPESVPISSNIEPRLPVVATNPSEGHQNPAQPMPSPSSRVEAGMTKISRSNALGALAEPRQAVTSRSMRAKEIITVEQHKSVPRWVAILLGTLVIVLGLAVTSIVLIRQPEILSANVTNDMPTDKSEQAQPDFNTSRQLAPLPVAVKNASVVNLGNDLLLIGGINSNGLTNDVWRYASFQEWKKMESLPITVQSAPTLFIGGEVWVVGGLNESGKPIDVVQRYNVEDNKWETLSTSLPKPLARSALAAYEGKIFLFGGWDGTTYQDTVYQYLSDEEGWQPFSAFSSPRADVGTAPLQDGIALIGGTREGEQALDEVIHFNPNSSNLLRKDPPLPMPIHAPKVITIGGFLYLSGTEGFLKREEDKSWQDYSIPTELLAKDMSVVSDNVKLILLGGEQNGQLLDDVSEYQVLFQSFIPVTR